MSPDAHARVTAHPAEREADGWRTAATDGQTVQCYQREMMCDIDADPADDFRSRPTSMEVPVGVPDLSLIHI